MSVDPIPAGYHAVTPHLIVDDAATAIRFYEEAFGATEKMRLTMGDGIAHAELRIGDSHVMLADEFPDMGFLGPKKRGGCTTSLTLYVPDVDAAFARAIAAGAIEERPVADQFYGDRVGTLLDPSGHRWSLATRKEEVSIEEMQRRLDAEMGMAG
jgi:PhnB protein